ncbi:hypothetical protein vseg_020328 [Gypsophila vaccaria]
MAGTNKKQIVGMMVIMSIAMYGVVTAKAACLSLEVCASIPLLNVQLGSQVGTPCCDLITGIAAADVELCLCGLLRHTSLGYSLASILGLPIVGGVLSPLLSLPYSVLDTEILALVNACKLDYYKYKCASY